MKEIITIQLGNFGNTLGKLFWEDLLYEQQAFKANQSQNLSNSKPEIFFHEDSVDTLVPRTIIIDSDPESVNALRPENIFSQVPDYAFISGSTGNDMNYANALESSQLIDHCLEACRKTVEKCESFQGYQLIHSIGGGTGSGLMSSFLEKIQEEDGSKLVTTFSCCPSSNISELPLEFINSCISIHNLTDLGSLCVMLDNQKTLSNYSKLAEWTGFNTLNQITRRQLSDFTSLLRFPSTSLTSYLQIRNFMTVYPRMHFFDINSSFELGHVGQDNIVERTWAPDNIFYQEDLKNSEIFAAIGVFRGNFDELQVNSTVKEWYQGHKEMFAKWLPSHLKSYFSRVTQRDSEYSLSCVKNSGNIRNLILRLYEQFVGILKKSEWVNLYLKNGIDSLFLDEVRDNLKDLHDEYEFWAVNTIEDAHEED